MEDFDDVWELYSQVDGNSDFEYPSRAIFKFRRLVAEYPKITFVMFSFKLYPGLSQRTPWTRLFVIFIIFEKNRVPLDTPLGVMFNMFLTFFSRSENQ